MKVRYFAWLRHRTGTPEEAITLPSHVLTVADLKAHLGERHPRFAEACSATGVVRCAVDQVYADDTMPIGEASEIAFFPPVTGG